MHAAPRGPPLALPPTPNFIHPSTPTHLQLLHPGSTAQRRARQPLHQVQEGLAVAGGLCGGHALLSGTVAGREGATSAACHTSTCSVAAACRKRTQ